MAHRAPHALMPRHWQRQVLKVKSFLRFCVFSYCFFSKLLRISCQPGVIHTFAFGAGYLYQVSWSWNHGRASWQAARRRVLAQPEHQGGAAHARPWFAPCIEPVAEADAVLQVWR